MSERTITTPHGIDVTVEQRPAIVYTCPHAVELVVPFPQHPCTCEHHTDVFAQAIHEALSSFPDVCSDCSDDILEASILLPLELEDPERAAAMRAALGIGRQ